MELSRRDLIKLGLLGSAALYLPVERFARAADKISLLSLPTPYTIPLAIPGSINASALPVGSDGYRSLTMTMQPRTVSMLGAARPSSTVWAYTHGNLVNPTIHVRKGQPLRITHVNELFGAHPVAGYNPMHGVRGGTSVHLHGSASLPQYDGYANDVTIPGQRKTYEYPNAQGARTLWYHDHGVHQTSGNAYGGLAGQYHLHDEMEDAFIASHRLPTGEFDIPLTLRDAQFAADGSLLWNDHDRSSLMGDVILANGVAWPYMTVKKSQYRFRVLNASISRSFNLSLRDPSGKAKMYVVATDGGFMPKGVRISSFRSGMAERYEIIIDFRDVPTGTKVELVSAEVKNNVDYLHTRKVMQFRATGDTTGVPAGQVAWDTVTFYSPQSSTSSTGYMSPAQVMGLTSSMAVKRRRFRLKHDDVTGEWTIDDLTWKDVEDSDYSKTIADVKAGDVEIWDWENSSGGWFHPLHIHLVDFKILSRRENGSLRNYEVGPKDVAYVGEGETVSLIMRFAPHAGRYMVHCHNLVHEDHDMMSQYRVIPRDGQPEYDPMGTRAY